MAGWNSSTICCCSSAAGEADAGFSGLRSRSRPLRQEVLEERDGCPFEHLKNLVESAESAVPGVWHIVLASVRVEVARQQQTFFGKGTELGDEASVGAVHCDDEIEPLEVVGRQRSRALVADAETGSRCDLDAPGIGRFPTMEGRGAGAIKVIG